MDTAANLARALEAAVHALRSYQHGNSSPELAASIADIGEHVLQTGGYDIGHKVSCAGDSLTDRKRGKMVREALVRLAVEGDDFREGNAMIWLATRSTSPRLARLARMIAE